MTKDELFCIVNSYVNEAIDILHKKTGKKISLNNLELSGRMSKTMGFAEYEGDYGNFHLSITISSKIFKRDSNVLRETCFHEVAHLYDLVLNRNWGHGETWVHLMNLLGVPPKAFVDAEDYENA